MAETLPFGEWVRRCRQSLDLTQADLARLVGCAVVTIRQIEQGRRRPSRQLADRLAAQLQILPDQRLAFVQRARGVTATAAQTPDAPTRQSTLPTPLTALIGRDREVASVVALLERDDVRLVTLTGPGGVGKTRLALAVGAQMPGEVVFVSLAPIQDPGQVASAIAQALAIRELPGAPILAAIQAALRGRRILILVDNAEHLPASVPLLVELLRGAPGIRLLVTSRARLHLSGEHEYPVAPLALPPEPPDRRVDGARNPGDAHAIASSPAVQLFLARAQAALATFTLNDANREVVAAICRRLDGLPLAIELAAARVKLLSPTTLHSRLHDRLSLLMGGPRDMPPRHQTLRDTIAWSYDLLTPTEQRLFERLGVFAGGWTLEAAVAVCADVRPIGQDDDTAGHTTPHAPPDHRQTTDQVFEALSELVDQSLVRLEESQGDQPRYVMLETIREFALERLEARAELDPLQQRHAHSFLQMAEEAEPYLIRPQRTSWLARLNAEHANLQAALAYYMQTPNDQALRFTTALIWFWRIRGYITEGLGWLLSALAQTAALGRTLTRARADSSAGIMLWFQGEYGAARPLLEESAAIYRESGQRLGLAIALIYLAGVCFGEHDASAASAILAESIGLLRDLGEPWWTGIALMSLGGVMDALGDFGSARALIAESQAIFQAIGDPWGLAYASLPLTYTWADSLGRGAALASQKAREAAVVATDDSWGSAIALITHGWAAETAGDQRAACAAYASSLAQCRAIGYMAGMAVNLARLAALAAQHRRPERAARLLGKADELCTTLGAQLVPQLPFVTHVPCTGTLADLQQQLGFPAFAAAWRAGHMLTLDQAVAEAHALLAERSHDA